MNEKWVVDASSLIVLGKLSLLHLLTHLSDELIIPNGVAREVLRGPRNDRAKIWMKKKRNQVPGTLFLTHIIL